MQKPNCYQQFKLRSSQSEHYQMGNVYEKNGEKYLYLNGIFNNLNMSV